MRLKPVGWISAERLSLQVCPLRGSGAVDAAVTQPRAPTFAQVRRGSVHVEQTANSKGSSRKANPGGEPGAGTTASKGSKDNRSGVEPKFAFIPVAITSFLCRADGIAQWHYLHCKIECNRIRHGRHVIFGPRGGVIAQNLVNSVLLLQKKTRSCAL